MSKDDEIIPRPVRTGWDSFWSRREVKDIDDFLRERPDVVEPGRFELTDEEPGRGA